MKKNFLFIIDRPEHLHLETDTTYALMKETFRRGHHTWVCYLEDLSIEKAQATGRLSFIEINRTRTNPWNVIRQEKRALSSMQIICMRKDPPVNIDYHMACSILSLAATSKTFIMNDPTTLRTFNEKLGIYYFPRYMPESIVTKQHADIIAFQKQYGDIVLKPLEGYAGKEILVIRRGDKNRNALLEISTANETRYIMVQRFIPEVSKGDKRVLLLNGAILGQQNRVAARDEYRSNISAGATSHKTTLTLREKKISHEVAQWLAQGGIYFAGIDLIGGYLTEINITSPTGLVKINEHEGTQLEKKVIDFLESKVCENT